MGWTYAFEDGVEMVGWDAAVLPNYSKEERADAYQARWGKSACPPTKGSDDEELLRRFCWAHNDDDETKITFRASIPRCWNCRANNSIVPGNKGNKFEANVGQCLADRLPCGCLWEEAAIELVMAKKLKAFFPQNDHPKAPKTLQLVARTACLDVIRMMIPGFKITHFFSHKELHRVLSTFTLTIDSEAKKPQPRKINKLINAANSKQHNVSREQLPMVDDNDDEPELSDTPKNRPGPSTREERHASKKARTEAAAKGTATKPARVKKQVQPKKRIMKPKGTKNPAKSSEGTKEGEGGDGDGEDNQPEDNGEDVMMG